MATNIMIRSGTTFGLVNFAGNLPGFLTPILNSALIKVIFTHNCCRLYSAYRMIIVCKTRYMSIMPNDRTRLYIWPHDQGHDHDHEELSTAWGHFWWMLASLYVLGTLIFAIFAYGTVQPFNTVSFGPSGEVKGEVIFLKMNLKI